MATVRGKSVLLLAHLYFCYVLWGVFCPIHLYKQHIFCLSAFPHSDSNDLMISTTAAIQENRGGC